MTSKELLSKLMESPDDWTFDCFQAFYKNGKLVFWISNGFLAFESTHGGGVRAPLDFWDRLTLWQWLKGVRRYYIVKTA